MAAARGFPLNESCRLGSLVLIYFAEFELATVDLVPNLLDDNCFGVSLPAAAFLPGMTITGIFGFVITLPKVILDDYMIESFCIKEGLESYFIYAFYFLDKLEAELCERFDKIS